MSVKANTPETIWLKDYTPPNHLVPEIRLFFDLGEETTIKTSMQVEPNPAGEAGAPLILHSGDQELVSIVKDGLRLSEKSYQREGEQLMIPGVNEPATLQITTRLRPKENTSLEGLYRSGPIYCTQCEAEGFRKITFFPDRPDVMSKFTVTIAADPKECPVMLSNGNRTSGGGYPDGRHWVTWEDPFPKPAYLFALVAGHLEGIEDQFKTASGREVVLRIYTEPHNVDKCDHAMTSLKRSMAWDEKVYGREYDLDLFNIVAVDDFNMGAMENKSLNIFNSKFILARPDTATDLDYLNIEAVVAHEYFHNWTGNRITCRDWFQLSLKEGLTVFRDQEFTADYNSRAVKRIQDVRMLRSAQFAEDAGPMSHPVRPDHYIEISNFYTVTVYEKGAEVVRMQHTLLGAEDYRKALDLYFERHDGEAVTVEDFVRCMEEVSGRDLSQFMNWYRQKGTPQLKASWVYQGGQLELTLEQSPPQSWGSDETWQPHHIPVKVGLVDRSINNFISSGSKDLPPPSRGRAGEGVETANTFGAMGNGTDLLPEGSRLLELTEKVQTFSFEGVPSDAVPSILREFSAPVLLQTDHSESDRLFLMANDSDAFNRWEAGQQVAETLLLQWVEDLQQQRELVVDEVWLEAIGKLLAEIKSPPPSRGTTLGMEEVERSKRPEPRDREGVEIQRAIDPAFTAEALILPTERWLAERMEVVDVEAIHAVREFAIRAIASVHQQQMSDLYHQLDPKTAEGRTLRNQLLGVLMRLSQSEVAELAQKQFESAGNMSDEIGALAALGLQGGELYESALEQFYQKWKGERLVIDKWFSLQASSSLPRTVERVEALLQHPDFDLANPNRARSLIGAFAHGNPLHFHDQSGAGYQFLADQVLQLDPKNPQVAARMVGAFNQWKRYDEERQQLMKEQLQRIVAKSDLSKDVYEIVSRSLSENRSHSENHRKVIR